MSVSAVTITCIGVFMVGFKFFDMFVNSVFWYLFNDVVPHNFLGRFLGLFRIVSNMESMIFGFFIFKYAESHMTEIYVGAALVYAIGMGLMCWKVKEGEYPPPPESEDGRVLQQALLLEPLPLHGLLGYCGNTGRIQCLLAKIHRPRSRADRHD
jgi:hypothetical protein